MEQTARMVTLTPEMAASILERDPHRRQESKNLVIGLADEITAGKWVFKDDAIIINNDGEIVDGIHRLLAVCHANKPIQTVLVENFNTKKGK